MRRTLRKQNATDCTPTEAAPAEIAGAMRRHNFATADAPASRKTGLRFGEVGSMRQDIHYHHQQPNPTMAELHDRMPVILEPSDWPLWLGEVEDDPATVLRPTENGWRTMWGRCVGKAGRILKPQITLRSPVSDSCPR
jgi:hypothetical protein